MRLLLLFLLVLPPASPQEAVDVYALLDKGDEEALRRLSPEDLLQALRKGRDLAPAGPLREKRKIKDAFGRETDLYLIVPKDPRGVLFLLHGLGGDGTQLKDRMYNRFAAREGLILAAPTAQKEPEEARNEDSFDQFVKDRLPHWWSYHEGNFVFSALSELKKEFPIDENRVFLSGYSMGGFGTWNMGLRYPDRFAAIVPMAGGISRAEYVNRRGHKKLRGLLFNACHVPAYFVHGDRDQTVPVRFDRMTRDDLEKRRYDHVYVEVPGGRHLLDVGERGKLMRGVQDWLKGRKRDPHPKVVRHASLGKRTRRSFWLQIDDFSNKTARVTAEIVEDNTVRVETEGVKSLTVFLDEKHIDIRRPVKVVINGREVFGGKVESDVGTVLESWKAREDRDLLYRARVSVDVP